MTVDTSARDNLWALFEGMSELPDCASGSCGSARWHHAPFTLAPYRDALVAGWQRAVIFATELGIPVYRRIGFEETSATISRYLWMRPGATPV